LSDRAKVAGVDAWIPGRPKLVKETNDDQVTTKPKKAPRIITPADQAIDAIEADKVQAQAKKQRDPSVSTALRQIGGGRLLG
jgi:hypothetical protein